MVVMEKEIVQNMFQKIVLLTKPFALIITSWKTLYSFEHQQKEQLERVLVED
jgi:hypothetical protein